MRDIDFLDFRPQCVHFGPFVLDQVLIGIALLLLAQNCLISRFDLLLQALVLGDIQGAEVFGPFKHHVFQHMRHAGLAGGFKC